MNNQRVARELVRLARELVAVPGTSYQRAVAKARKMARRTKELWYVVKDDGFHATDDEGLDTFFAGIEPEAVVHPDGMVEN